MTIGTRSVLYGAHCAVLHPWFLAVAWSKLYGFPWDVRLWASFCLHDIGYISKPSYRELTISGLMRSSDLWRGTR